MSALARTSERDCRTRTTSENCTASVAWTRTKYTYDYNGNMLTSTTGSNTTSYTWDFENRLMSVTLPGSGGTVSFKYDPFGRRIWKSSSAGTSIYAYDGYNFQEEANSSGVAVARYTQGPILDEPAAMLRGGTTSFYEADGLGSITSLSSSAGSLVQTYGYDSFGKQTNSSGSLTNPFQYTARESDPETGLYYYRARYYDPASGRFLAEDPEGFNAGVNFYAYVLNNPTVYTDPFGLDVIVCFFPVPAGGFGHTGFGFPGDPYTAGFYPTTTAPVYPNRAGPLNPNRAHGPGGLFPDVGEGPRVCKLIHTTSAQDACMLQQRVERLQNPGTYDVATRQCTGFVHNSLKGCGIPAGSNDPRPNHWFPTLPGQVLPNLPSNAPLPRSAP
jgi:RHS repeat-associated protein